MDSSVLCYLKLVRVNYLIVSENVNKIRTKVLSSKTQNLFTGNGNAPVGQSFSVINGIDLL